MVDMVRNNIELRKERRKKNRILNRTNNYKLVSIYIIYCVKKNANTFEKTESIEFPPIQNNWLQGATERKEIEQTNEKKMREKKMLFIYHHGPEMFDQFKLLHIEKRFICGR